MRNPFKTGDKVVRLHYDYGNLAVGDIGVVSEVCPFGVRMEGAPMGFVHLPADLCAAIAGQDYPAPMITGHTVAAARLGHTAPLQPSGHLSDGSGVQKHSAGGLYPVVIYHRDKQLPGEGKYDVGLIWPDQQDPIWFRDYNTAVAVAEIIKENHK